MTEQLAAALAAVVGPDHVLDDPDMTASYAVDWTGRFGGEALLVVRPGDADEVAEVVRRCADVRRAEIVPQGGNTGLVGGSVPRWRPMVVLSTRRLNELGPIDDGALQVTARRRRHAGPMAGARPRRRGRRARRLRQPRLGDGRRCGGDERRRLAGRALRHHAIAGRRASRRCSPTGRPSGRSADCRRRRSGCTPVGALRQRGHAGRAHRHAAARRAVVPAHGDGDGHDGRPRRGGGGARPPAARRHPPRRRRADPARGDGRRRRAPRHHAAARSHAASAPTSSSSAPTTRTPPTS